MTVRLADIYEPELFQGLAQLKAIELNRFINSGVAILDPSLQAMIDGGGMTGELTQFDPLGTPEPNYSNDNPAQASTPNKIGTREMKYRIAMQNQSWSTMSLARQLALQDPLPAITGGIGKYWATINERRLIYSALGVLADNKTNDNGSMVKTVATDSADAITDAERISGDVVIDAKQTMGDHGFELSAIAMHSQIYSRLQKQDLIEFIQPSGTDIRIPTYLEYTVIQDDSMPAVAGTNRITYTCVLFGAGAFAMAEKTLEPEEAMEYDRAPAAGLGGGQTVLHSRRGDLIHPAGTSWLDDTRTGQSASFSELQLADNWDRVWERKQIPLAFLEVND